METELQDEARYERMRFSCLLRSLGFNKRTEQNGESSGRKREQFPQIVCLSNKGYQILCEQNNCALTVVTEGGLQAISTADKHNK